MIARLTLVIYYFGYVIYSFKINSKSSYRSNNRLYANKQSITTTDTTKPDETRPVRNFYQHDKTFNHNHVFETRPVKVSCLLSIYLLKKTFN